MKQSEKPGKSQKNSALRSQFSQLVWTTPKNNWLCFTRMVFGDWLHRFVGQAHSPQCWYEAKPCGSTTKKKLKECHGMPRVLLQNFPQSFRMSAQSWSLVSHLSFLGWFSLHFPSRQVAQKQPKVNSDLLGPAPRFLSNMKTVTLAASGSVWSEKKNFWRPNMIWLVVYLPLWKIWVSWDVYSQYMENNPNVPYCKDNWKHSHFAKQSWTCGTNKCCHDFTRTVRYKQMLPWFYKNCTEHVYNSKAASMPCLLILL